MANKTKKEANKPEKPAKSPESFGLRQFFTRREQPMGKSLDYFQSRRVRRTCEGREASL